MNWLGILKIGSQNTVEMKFFWMTASLALVSMGHVDFDLGRSQKLNMADVSEQG